MSEREGISEVGPRVREGRESRFRVFNGEEGDGGKERNERESGLHFVERETGERTGRGKGLDPKISSNGV